jgi:prepilin-type N-terminal cleavage/methylation domain-containing protein
MVKLQNKAFSLVELAIVIMVIALLISGMTAGNHLVRQASIQTALKEIVTIQSAYNNFFETYSEIPGDFSVAYDYFAEEDDVICGTASECNGDGDGKLEIQDKRNSEIFRAWQHLSISGLLKEEYSGVWGEELFVGQSKIRNGQYSFKYADKIAAVNVLKLGSEISVNENSEEGVLEPMEAFNMDKKVDDGKPNRGKVQAVDSYLGGDIGVETNYDRNCVLLASGKYKVGYKESKACALVFALD